MTGTQVTHVPYKGSAPAVTDLIAGQVQVMFDNTPNVLPHVQGRQAEGARVSSKARSPFAPEIPSVDEAGVPGYDVTVWFGVLTVAGTPPDIVEAPERRDGPDSAFAGSEGQDHQSGRRRGRRHARALQRFPEAEVARWAKVVQEAGIKAD